MTTETEIETEEIESTEPETESSTASSETTTEEVSSPDTKTETPSSDEPATEVEEFEEYEIETSEDSPLTEEEINEVAADAARLNLSKEDAQKLVKAREDYYNKGRSTYTTEVDKYIQERKAEFDADPDFAVGEKRVASFASIKRVIDKFGDDGMRQLINTPGIGDNVVLAKFLKRLGDTIAPETQLEGNKGSQINTNPTEKSPLEEMYPDFYKK